MAKVPYISDAEFKASVLDSSTPVLVDFTAAWCGPCKAIAPLLDQLADQHGEKLKIVKIDTDVNNDVPASFGVQSIPTLLLFKDGKLVDRRVGGANKATLDAFVSKAL